MNIKPTYHIGGWSHGGVIVAIAITFTIGAMLFADEQKYALAEVPPVPEEAGVVSLGAGCFWCVEAVLEKQDGIIAVTSGYMGGAKPNPTYKEICSGTTGHAEVVRVIYDPKKLSFEHLLTWFWKLHDPTQLNRQGNDVGTQYRSAIFYSTEEQKIAAEKSKVAEDASGNHKKPIVTEITKTSKFYPAEKYHQKYYQDNKSDGYCRFVILPKLKKLGLDP